METSFLPTPIMPAPIITDALVDYPSCTSPLDSDLQRLKVERQTFSKPTPRESASPALQERMDLLNLGVDPSAQTSPVGAALLERRAQRQAAQRSARGLPETVPDVKK